MKLSIIIPAYNEEQYIEKVLDKIWSVQLQPGVEKEVVVVNDGSSDSTREILDKLDVREDLKIFHHGKNNGKTAAVLLGIEEATGELIIIQDADTEYTPDDFPALIEPILQDRADVVFGSRWLGSIKNMKLINRISNRISTFSVNLLCGTRFTDIYGCYKVFKKEMFSKFVVGTQNFGFDSEIIMKFIKLGARIEEVPVTYVARTVAEGKKINWFTAIEMYWALIRYRFGD